MSLCALRPQESTSEAVNGYYAVMLLGEVLGDPDLRRWGQLLAAVEVTGAQTYWQVGGNEVKWQERQKALACHTRVPGVPYVVHRTFGSPTTQTYWQVRRCDGPVSWHAARVLSNFPRGGLRTVCRPCTVVPYSGHAEPRPRLAVLEVPHWAVNMR